MNKRCNVLNDFWYFNGNIVFIQGRMLKMNDFALFLTKTVISMATKSSIKKTTIYDANWFYEIEKMILLNLDDIVCNVRDHRHHHDYNRNDAYRECMNVFSCIRDAIKIGKYNDIVQDFVMKCPIQVDLTLTYDCNNRCSFCYHGGPARSKELSITEWCSSLDKLKDAGVIIINFTGGEPTLRFSLLEHCLDRYYDFFRFQMTTNGTLLSFDKCVRLKDKGLDFVQISVEHCIAAKHDDICGRLGSWIDTIHGIQNSLKAGLSVGTITTITERNKNDIENLVNFLISIGVTNISVNSLFYDTRAKNMEDRVSDKELYDVLKRIVMLTQNRAKASFLFPTCYRQINSMELGFGIKKCTAAVSTLHIEPNGNVIPCQSWTHESCGNILRDDWSKIWFSDVANSVRSRQKKGKCLGCEWIAECNGACPLIF